MSYEYILKSKNMKSLIENFSEFLIKTNKYHIEDLTEDGFTGFIKTNKDNKEIIKWGGDFYVNKNNNNETILTINSNKNEIMNEIMNFKNTIEIDIEEI